MPPSVSTAPDARARLAAGLAGIATLTGFGLLAGCDGGPDTCLPECTATREYDAIAYDLRASLDWDARRLTASEDITVALRDGAAPVIELDADVAVSRVSADGVELGAAHDASTRTLWVDLTSIAGAGGELTFTVEYRAEASVALVFAGPRDDDPVTARVAYTNSEPDRGRRWLVSNDHPSDRARFSIALEVDAGHDVIANGERLGDEVRGGRRVVRHAIAHPLPTYMMAFAAGELEHAERTDGRVPLSLWFRRGAAVDADAHLAINARHLAHFEALLGPYPFERYATVLLPGFPGGMENATITFNSETSGQGAINETLNAHELGHHWYGDWVTMRDYRDVWIKEGMATLLAAEASRPLRDGEARGRLFGASFNFSSRDKVIDDQLSGLSRYTSGPYERAAWTLTQVRARVGEEAFWGTLRDVLAAHALGTIDTDTFVRAFAPELDGAAIDQWLSALALDGAPRLDAEVTGEGVRITVADPRRLLLDPIPLTVIDAAGGATEQALVAGAAHAITLEPGGYLAPDERDVHPYWYLSFDLSQGAQEALHPRLAPSAPGAPGALAAFTTRSAAAQEQGLTLGALGALAPADLAQVHASLDSTLARRALVHDACAAMAALPVADPAVAAWRAALAPLLEAPALLGYSTPYAPCARAVADAGLGAELAALAALGAAIPPSRLARLEYLLGFDHGSAATLASLSRIATSAPSIRHRDLALDRIGAQVRPPYSGVAAGDLAAYRRFFRDRVAATTSGTRLLILWRGIVGVGAGEALPGIAELLHEIPLDERTQTRIVCEAFDLATPAEWVEFQNAAEPWSELTDDAAAALEDPSACDR